MAKRHVRLRDEQTDGIELQDHVQHEAVAAEIAEMVGNPEHRCDDHPWDGTGSSRQRRYDRPDCRADRHEADDVMVGIDMPIDEIGQ